MNDLLDSLKQSLGSAIADEVAKYGGDVVLQGIPAPTPRPAYNYPATVSGAGVQASVAFKQELIKLKQEHDQAVAMVGDKDKDRQIEVMNIKADYDAQMARVQMDYETKLMAAQVKMATDNSMAGDGSKDAADAAIEMARLRMETDAKFAKLESDYQRELLKVGKDLQIAQMQAQTKQAEQSQQKGLRRDSDLAKFEKIHEQIQAKLEKLDSSMKDMENTEIVFDRDPKTNRIAKAKRVRRSVQ
jgi:hypothetical protein